MLDEAFNKDLNEDSSMSYYAMYMAEHPEDQLMKLTDNLIGQFAKDLKKDNIRIEDCCDDQGFADLDKIEEF